MTYTDGYDADGTLTITIDHGTDADSGIDAASAVPRAPDRRPRRRRLHRLEHLDDRHEPRHDRRRDVRPLPARASPTTSATRRPTPAATSSRSTTTAPSAPALTLAETGALVVRLGHHRLRQHAGRAHRRASRCGRRRPTPSPGIERGRLPRPRRDDRRRRRRDRARSPAPTTGRRARPAAGAQTAVAHNRAGRTSSSEFTVVHDTSRPDGRKRHVHGRLRRRRQRPDRHRQRHGRRRRGRRRLGGARAPGRRRSPARRAAAWGAWTPATSPDTVADGACARYRLRVSRQRRQRGDLHVRHDRHASTGPARRSRSPTRARTFAPR